MGGRHYRIAPGVELVPVDGDRYVLRSDFEAVELSGDAARDFAERVLSELTEPMSLDAILQRVDQYAPSTVEDQLDALVGMGLLVESSDADPAKPAPFDALLAALGQDPGETVARLATTTVAIFGLEAHGAHLARILAQLGIGTIRLVDPGRLEPNHLRLTPIDDPELVGMSRQSATAQLLAPFGTTVEYQPHHAELDADLVAGALRDCTLAFGCFDRRLSAASQWLNRAALQTSVPVLFGELRPTSTLTGPLFLPHRSACFMCYRMRAIACAPDFEQAMAFEEHLDGTRTPDLAGQPLMPVLPESLASSMAMEALRLLLGMYPPIHVDSVAEYDAMTGSTQAHPVLAVPDCPVCSKKKPRVHPPLDELIACGRAPGDLLSIVDRLVDTKTGIVSGFAAVPRDTSEVPIPIVWRAKVANHRFFDDHDEERAGCSGKGMTQDQAWVSCLGEAVERYAGARWDPDELLLARRSELDGRSLDPVDLVLFAEEQYEHLPYSRADPDAEIAWIRGRSLVHGDDVWLPAVSVLMDYPIEHPEEFLFPITSNGLAAGATLCGAVLSAIGEVLERDAFLVAWFNRLAGHTYDASTHPDADVRHLAALYRRRSIDLALIELPTDHPYRVVVGIALLREGEGPAAVVGLGADIDVATAARKAAMEVGQVRPSLRRRARLLDGDRVAELAADPSLVTTMDDHALLYAHPSTVDEFDFLFGERRDWPERVARREDDVLEQLVAHFAAVHQDVLYANLTPPDMEALGVHAARAIVPGFQPISFGRHERRLGGSRLFRLPVELGVRDVALDPAGLNPMPHPMA